MADSFSKKSQQQKKAKKKLDKLEKREERKSCNDKGKSLDEMMVYVDEYGNLTDVHPDDRVKAPPPKYVQHNRGERDAQTYNGTIALFFDDKGYGFISDDDSKTNVFVHQNKLMEKVSVNDRVTFKKERTPKGYSAYDVKKI